MPWTAGRRSAGRSSSSSSAWLVVGGQAEDVAVHPGGLARRSACCGRRPGSPGRRRPARPSARERSPSLTRNSSTSIGQPFANPLRQSFSIQNRSSQVTHSPITNLRTHDATERVSIVPDAPAQGEIRPDRRPDGDGHWRHVLHAATIERTTVLLFTCPRSVAAIEVPCAMSRPRRSCNWPSCSTACEDVVVWVKDRDGRYRWVNRAFLINYSLDDAGDRKRSTRTT